MASNNESAAQCAAYLIVRFLDTQQAMVDEATRESLSVARDCIASSFDISETNEKTFADMVGNTTLLSMVEGLSTIKDQVADLKEKGNDCMRQEKFEEAEELYSKALQVTPNNAILYCNRAAARCRLSKYELAASDCRNALSIDENYAKAWGRLATALSALGRHFEAAESFKRASEIEPNVAAWKEGLEKERASAGGPAGPGAGGAAPGPFSGAPPNFLMNMMSSPQMMQMAQQMMSDPNMTSMMQNIMGNQMGGGGSAGGAGGSMPNMDNIMQMAQSFASQMESSNPDLINQLRQQYGQGRSQGQDPGQPPQGGQPPPNN